MVHLDHYRHVSRVLLNMYLQKLIFQGVSAFQRFPATILGYGEG